jgi:hypothetical protein
MNGELAQLVALVSYGNAVLAGHLPDDDIDNDNTVGPTGTVCFAYSSGPRSVIEWVQHMRLQGVERIELDAVGQLGKEADNESLPRHLRTAFSTTLGPTIVAHTKRNSEVWRSESTVIPEAARTGDLVWHISYRQVYNGPRLALSHTSVADASRALQRSLTRIRQFAEVNGHLSWGEFFGAASSVLAGKTTSDDAWSQLAAGSPPDAGVLLAAAAKGWAFGGMGSWNDLDFSGDDNAQANYNRVTSEHFQASLTAIDAAANAR